MDGVQTMTTRDRATTPPDSASNDQVVQDGAKPVEEPRAVPTPESPRWFSKGRFFLDRRS
jgi:hypothetical protein